MIGIKVNIKLKNYKMFVVDVMVEMESKNFLDVEKLNGKKKEKKSKKINNIGCYLSCCYPLLILVNVSLENH